MIASGASSSILGWISIACWIVVNSPQIYENYVLQSGEGLSVMFVLIWLAGDLCNLTGAALAGLIPTVIILACYYSLCDSTLLCQIFYYRWKHGQPLLMPQHAEDSERVPLLLGTEGEKRHLSTKALIIRYTAALVFVCMVGTTVWWITRNDHEQTPKPVPKKDWWESQIFGWASAVLFIGARVPQIMKNFKTRCEGLSPALFFFAICGNITYLLSILAKSTDRDYLITNASWLAGAGTRTEELTNTNGINREWTDRIVGYIRSVPVCVLPYARQKTGRGRPGNGRVDSNVYILERILEVRQCTFLEMPGHGWCSKEWDRGEGVAKTIGIA